MIDPKRMNDLVARRTEIRLRMFDGADVDLEELAAIDAELDPLLEAIAPGFGASPVMVRGGDA